jgi:hypothetical protein
MDYSDAGKKGYEKTRKAIEAHRNRQHHEAVMRYEENPKVCPTCGEVLPYEKRGNKFCDHSCAASYHLGSRISPKKRTPKTCAHCGNPVEKRNNKYCDTCIEAGVYINKITDWEHATDDRIRKRLLIEMRGHCCELCQNNTWTGQPIPLELHHIDGNADNSDQDNLLLICPNCHALTDNYKGANMGGDSSRQKKRRRRYKDGNTY